MISSTSHENTPINQAVSPLFRNILHCENCITSFIVNPNTLCFKFFFVTFNNSLFIFLGLKDNDRCYEKYPWLSYLSLGIVIRKKQTEWHRQISFFFLSLFLIIPLLLVLPFVLLHLKELKFKKLGLLLQSNMFVFNFYWCC